MIFEVLGNLRNTLLLNLIVGSLALSGPQVVWSSTVENLCQEIGRKLGSVKIDDCAKQSLLVDGTLTTGNRPLAYKFYPPLEGETPRGRVLLMGGIHGDEYSAVSIMFKWLDKLNEHHSGLFHWQVVPLLNPDGLLGGRRAQRQNANGVDLNRNFPSSDWEALAHDYWINRTKRNARRYPGEKAESEIETKWFVETIKQFKPDVIVAVHAPHKLVDYDGPEEGPEQLGNLHLKRLGTYPGSLGNYGGVDLGIPVVTIELPSAGIMPSNEEISQMWTDLVGWLIANVRLEAKNETEMTEKESTYESGTQPIEKQ